MLASGLVLILLETALFLAFHERRALDGIQSRALRDGKRLVRLHQKIPLATFSEELEAARVESGVKRIDHLRWGTRRGGLSLRRDVSKRELVAQFEPVSLSRPTLLVPSNRRLTIRFDLAGPMDEAKETAKTQAVSPQRACSELAPSCYGLSSIARSPRGLGTSWPMRGR
jgi:hypothetical protein